jgi:hypothetical protein
LIITATDQWLLRRALSGREHRLARPYVVFDNDLLAAAIEASDRQETLRKFLLEGIYMSASG